MTKIVPEFDDTISAVSTALGPGGIGIVRLSGALAVEIALNIFRFPSGKKPLSLRSHKVYYGHVVDPHVQGQIVDEVLVVFMRAPKSYTCEDVVEINCHGGLMAVKAVLGLTISLGARLAAPGEFTQRAFVNGRLDLVQAEALADIIRAKTQSALRVSARQLKGQLTLHLEKIREELMDVYGRIEALVNFPEEGIEEAGRLEITASLGQAKDKIDKLLATSDQGRILREGAKVVLCGRPNVGKSSLLNVLLKHPRAIVSEFAGTTRDTLEESVEIRGIALELIDTAGILEPRDSIEEEAVKRSRVYIENADLALLMFSAGQKLAPEDFVLAQSLRGQNILVVVNKSDLKRVLLVEEISALLPGVKIVFVSAAEKTGIDELEKAIEENILHGAGMDMTNVLLTNARHVEALKNAAEYVQQAQKLFQENISLEFISENLKEALGALDRITGKDIDEDLLNEIFSNFCIGK